MVFQIPLNGHVKLGNVNATLRPHRSVLPAMARHLAGVSLAANVRSACGAAIIIQLRALRGHATFAPVNPGADKPRRQHRSFPGCLALAQPKALNLTGGSLRQIVEELDRPRVFMGGQTAFHECLEIIAARIQSGFQHNKSLGLGKTVFVGHADDCGFQHGRMLNERRLRSRTATHRRR